MSTVVWQQNRRRQPPMPKLCSYMRDIFDQNRDLNVAEMIEELDTYDFQPVELQWIIDNKKGKVQAWAKKEIKNYRTAIEDAPDPPE